MQNIADAELIERIKKELRDELLQPSATAPGLGHNGGPPLVDPPVYDILEFCVAHKISRSTLYNLWTDGIGPKFYRIGSSVKITGESAQAWRREREAATAKALESA
jgi:predicted DNA-binding transcriptional regulator AlpA